MPFEALKELVSPLIRRSPFKPAKPDPIMPAPVQDADISDASSPPQRKSNAWPTEERDDIYTRRQQGEKWDTICLDYPHRSKHAMQQQYSIMKKQAILKTPPKGRGRRKAKPPALASPAVMNSVKKVSKRRTSPEDADDQSDSDSDGRSTPSVPAKPAAGYDGPVETDNDSESTREPDSARRQRLRRRLKQTSGDEDEQPVSTRPKRTRASGVNYSLLQNSGYGLEDQADEAAAESNPDEPVRKSKIISLKMGTPKTPMVDEARRPRKSLNIEVNDDDTSTRRSRRMKNVVNGKTGYLASPLSHTADEEANVPGGKRVRRSLLPDTTIEDDSDVRATRSSKKRKNSEIEINEAQLEQVAAVDSENKDLPFRKKKRQARPKEHLGFLPNGQPRLRRRRRTRKEMEEAERNTPNNNASAKRRRSTYQFPFLEGYNGPAPPDMAAILARQEHERQNPAPESDSEPESTSSSLQSLDDDDEDVTDIQPQKANAPTVDEEVSPLTRPNEDEQLRATVIEQPLSARNPSLTPGSPLDMADVVFYAEDLDRARENARRLRASNDEHRTAITNKLTAAENNLGKERARNEDLSRELQDLRKEHDRCESKANDAEAIAQHLKGLEEISSLYGEALEKLDASEKATKEEKIRNVKLEEELSGSRTQATVREKVLEFQIAELSNKSAAEKQSWTSEEITKLKTDFKKELERVNRDLSTGKTEKEALVARNSELIVNNEALRRREKELEADTIRLNRKLTDMTAEHEVLLKERTAGPTRNLKPTNNEPVATKDGATDTMATPQAIKLPSTATLFDLISGRQPPSPSTINTNTVPITAVKPHLEQIRRTHFSIGYNLRVSSESHTTHDTALNTLHEKLEEGDISMNKVRERVKELVAGSSKVGKGLKSATEWSEVAKGRVMGLWDVVEPPLQ